MPILSIITITYNAEQFLTRTLDSVAKALEKLPNKTVVEYLIIDGKSKDKTLEIAQKYAFITKTFSEPDRGLYDAMNRGMTLAKGQYLWFLNAGDEVHDEDVLLKLLQNIEKYKADVLYSDALFVNDDGSSVGLRSQVTPHTLPKKIDWKAMRFGMKICHQAFIAHRNVVGQYDIENLSADLDWEINCLKLSTKIEHLDFVLCKYLMGGISVQKHRKSLIDRAKVLQKHFGTIPAIAAHFWIILRAALKS